MSHTRLLISAAIIALFVGGGFVLSVPHTGDIAETTALPAVPSVPDVTLRDTFKKGVHTISGSIEAPDACTTVTAFASSQGEASSTESILVEISTQSDGGVCLQLPTRVSFETTVTAPVRLPFTVMVDGALATSSML